MLEICISILAKVGVVSVCGSDRSARSARSAQKSVAYPGLRMHTTLPFITVAAVMATAAALQTVGGDDFGDGSFQPHDLVTIHNVSNLDEGLNAKVIAYDNDKELYVVRALGNSNSCPATKFMCCDLCSALVSVYVLQVKDAGANIWGLRAEKLRPLRVLEGVGEAWQDVPEGVVSRCSSCC